MNLQDMNCHINGGVMLWLKPDTREGSYVLTETLAQYTEMMLYKNAHVIEKA
ncbi:MAG: hypothetical protein R3A12_08765 [Ignavibacteria bacterium]